MWGSGGIAPISMTSELEEGNHGDKGPGTFWIGGWVGPRASLDDVEKRKIITGMSDCVHRLSDVRQIEIHAAEPVIPDLSPFEVEIAITR
jgi:hypothetical protein